MRRTATLSALAGLLLAAAPPPAARPPTMPVVVENAEYWDIPSTATDRTYRIFVYRPPGAPPPQGWPVVIVLDALTLFDIAAAMVRVRATAGELSPAVVVGVGYPSDDVVETMRLRMRDLTPTRPPPAKFEPFRLPGATPDDTGGAARFRRFLRDELQPALDARYPLDRDDRMLVGHSFGGLFALDTMFREPASFRTFAIASPSIHWDGQAVLQGEAAFARAVRAGTARPRVLVMAGGAEDDPAAVPAIGVTRAALRRLLAGSAMVPNARALGARLARLRGKPPYEVRTVVFPRENHLSVQAPALGRALGWALHRADVPPPPPAGPSARQGSDRNPYRHTSAAMRR